MSIQTKVMLKVDTIEMLGKDAKAHFRKLCQERKIECNPFSFEYTEEHLKCAEETLKLWRKTEKFKVGDKVYVVSTSPTLMKDCIRAVVTEIGDDGWGYRLRAFEQDLPGIYMFNMWDKDLQIRVGKKKKPTPKKLLISED
jgi:hypothetical protein